MLNLLLFSHFLPLSLSLCRSDFEVSLNRIVLAQENPKLLTTPQNKCLRKWKKGEEGEEDETFRMRWIKIMSNCLRANATQFPRLIAATAASNTKRKTTERQSERQGEREGEHAATWAKTKEKHTNTLSGWLWLWLERWMNWRTRQLPSRRGGGE